MENQGNKNQNTERKYLENMWNNQFLKVKNSLLEFEKESIGLNGRKLKDRKEKVKREIEELFYKPFIVSKDDMDRFEGQEMKKIRPVIRKWFDRLINKNVMGKKSKIIRGKLKGNIIRDIRTLFETNKEERKKKKHNGRINKNRIIRDIRTLFETNKEKEERKANEKIIKYDIIRDIRILFEQEKEEDYYKPKRVNNFWNNNRIEYESNGDKNRNWSLDEYLNKIETYSRNMIINLRKEVIINQWKEVTLFLIQFN